MRPQLLPLYSIYVAIIAGISSLARVVVLIMEFGGETTLLARPASRPEDDQPNTMIAASAIPLHARDPVVEVRRVLRK